MNAHTAGTATPAAFTLRLDKHADAAWIELAGGNPVEIQLEESPDRPMLEDMLKRLEEAEREVNRIPMPLAYAENLYFFREHIDVVRRRILRRLSGAAETKDLPVQVAS